jgi:hypothetical protein
VPSPALDSESAVDSSNDSDARPGGPSGSGAAAFHSHPAVWWPAAAAGAGLLPASSESESAHADRCGSGSSSSSGRSSSAAVSFSQ